MDDTQTAEEWVALQVADHIADYLFKNDQNEIAERLVLTSVDGKNLGGWCRRAVVDVIVGHISPQLKGTK